MRVVSWNLNNRKNNEKQWDFLRGQDADVILLQEVHSLPPDLEKQYSVVSSSTVSKFGEFVARKTVVMVRGEIVEQLQFSCELPWVNGSLADLSGAFVGVKVVIEGREVNVVSVYNPHWQIDNFIPEGTDTSGIKMDSARGLWASDLFWFCMKNNPTFQSEDWLVAGDFNLCETLDTPKPKGHAEFLDRMNAIGFTDCLRSFNGKLTPTYEHHSGDELINQLDYMFTTNGLSEKLKSCETADPSIIFGEKTSDHLPVVGDFG